MVGTTPKHKTDHNEHFGVETQKSEISGRIRKTIRESGGNAVVAEKSGVPLRTISNYTRAISEPKIIALSRVAKVCGVSLDWIADGAGPKERGATSPGAPDQETLRTALVAAEDLFKTRTYTPEQKAEIILTLYGIGVEDSN
jgi:transcriptional regulator with XRE-family HTH domain